MEEPDSDERQTQKFETIKPACIYAMAHETLGLF